MPCLDECAANAPFFKVTTIVWQTQLGSRIRQIFTLLAPDHSSPQQLAGEKKATAIIIKQFGFPIRTT